MLKNVSPGLIENVKDLKIALNELTVHDLNVYSMCELYYKVAHKLNEVISELSRFEGVLSDEVIKQNEKLIYLLGEGLENEVIKNIDRLIEQNFFEEIINEKIFSDLNNKIDNFKSEIDSQFTHIDSQLAHITNSFSYIPISQFGEIDSDDNTSLFNEVIENIPEYSIIDLEGKEFKIKNIDINKSNIGFRNGKIITCITNTVGYYNSSIAIKENNTNIIFEDITIELDSSNIGQTLKPRGIVVVSSNTVNIDKCKFLGFQEQPIRIEQSNNVSIKNCTFVNCSNLDGYGSVSIFMSDDIIVNDNKMYNNGVGVSVFGKSGKDFTKNIIINNNYIQGDIDNTNGMGVYCLKNIDKLQINNNFIENYKNECIVMTNISNPNEFKIKNIQVNNNSCYNFLYAGISCDVDCENIVINGNLLEGNSQPILIKNSNNAIISNNNIIGKNTTASAHGINIVSSEKIEVLNNNIKGLFINSIFNNQSVFLSICNNLIDIPINGVGIGYYQPNGVSQQGFKVVGNFLNAEDTSVPLIKHRGGDNLRNCLISNNYCINGTLGIDYAQYTYIINNIFLSINSSYTLYDNGSNCIIKDNQGIKNTYVVALDNFDSLPTINPSKDRGRIIQVQGTTDMYYICNQSEGHYSWKKVQLTD